MSYVALTTPEMNALRGGGHTVKGYLSVVPLATVATALVDQISFDRVVHTITVDNTSGGWTDVKEGMTCYIGSTAGAHDIGIFRVRKTPTADTLYIQAFSQGDFGLIGQPTLKPIGDNAHITIVNDYNLWSVAPRIVVSGDTSTFYKDYDTAWSDQTTTAPPCPLNIGPHIAQFEDTPGGGTASISFTATVDVWLSETVSAYLWDVDDGSITVGSSSTQSITVSFPTGHRVVSCKVTLSSGAVLYAERHVFIHDSSSEAPLDVVAVRSDKRDRDGRVANLTLADDLADTNLEHGAMAIYWEVQDYGGTAISSAVDQLVGWVMTRNFDQQPGEQNHTIQLHSGLQALKGFIAYGQQLLVKDTPANWQETTQALCHANFMAFYLIRWHTSLYRLFDFDFDDSLDDYLFQVWLVPQGDIPSQLAAVYGRLGAWIGQRGDGTLVVRLDPLLQGDTFRSGLATRATLTEDDIAAIQYRAQWRAGTTRVEAAAFSYDSGTQTITPLKAAAPGTLGGLGKRVQKDENRLVADQSELNTIAANLYARLNNPYSEVTLELAGLYDVFEPAENAWVALDLSGLADWSEPISQVNAVVTGVSRQLRDGTGATTLSLEFEVTGVDAPGETIVIPVSPDAPSYDSDGGLDIDYPAWEPDDWIIDYDLLDDESDGDTLPASAALIGWGQNAFGYAPTKVLPDWSKIKDKQASHLIRHVMTERDSAFFTTELYSGALGVYILEFDSGNNNTDLMKSDSALASSPSWSTLVTRTGDFNLLRPVWSSGAMGLLMYSPLAYAASMQAYQTIDFSGSTGWQNYTIVRGTETGGVVESVEYVTNAYYVYVDFEFSEDVTVYGTKFDFWADDTYNPGYGNRPLNVSIKCYDSDDDELDDTMGGAYPAPIAEDTWYRDVTRTPTGGSVSNVRWIQFRFTIINNPDTYLKMDNIAVLTDVELNSAALVYTPDDGSNEYASFFGGGGSTGGAAADWDDLGVIVASSGAKLYYSPEDYTAELLRVTSFSVLPAFIVAVVVPAYLTAAKTTANDSASALEVLVATYSADSAGATLYRVVLDATAGTYTATDISPDIAGVLYSVVDNANALGIYEDGTEQVIYALATPEADAFDPGKTIAIIRSEDGGATWTLGGEFDAKYLYVSSKTALWLSGGNDGIGYSSDSGATFTNRTSDYATDVDSTLAGVEVLE